QNRIVRTLDARHVDETCRAADQNAAWEHRLRNRLPAAFGDRAGTVRNALSAFEHIADRRMRLEALELFKGSQIRVLVVEVNYKADGHEIVVEVVEERATTRRAVERPAERVLHQALLVLLGLDLPKLFQPDAEFLRLASFRKTEAGDELLGERSARALADQNVLAEQCHAGLVVRPLTAVALHTHVAGNDAGDSIVFVKDQFGGGKAGIDFHPERFRLLGQPLADIAERD